MKEAKHTRPLVEVVWDDANTGEDQWSPVDDLPCPERAYTIGFLLKDEPDYVVVAQTWGLKEDGSEEVGGTWAIPRGMIIRVTDLARDGEHAS